MRLFTCAVVFTILTPWAMAAEPAPTAAVIAPFIDDQTVAIGWMNPAWLDLDAIEAMVVETLKAANQGKLEDPSAGDIAAAKTTAKAWLEEFTKAGGQDVYMIASLADLPEAEKPFVVAPLGPKADVQAISALLFSGRADGPTTTTDRKPGEAYPRVAVERIGAAVVFGSGKTIERLKKLTPAARPEIAQAFGVAGGAPACIAVVPTADNRRVIEDMIPTLPRELGGDPITVVTRGAMWMALGIQTKGGVSAKVVVQSQDAVAAQALGGVIDKGLKYLIEQDCLRGLTPSPEQFAALLKPTVSGDQLALEVKGETVRETIGKLVAPPLARARRTAKHTISANNMRGIMTALYKRGEKNQSQWPENLNVLVKEGYTPEASLVNPYRPGVRPGYVYVRPSEALSKQPERLVLYEAFDQWGEGIYVGFGDAHVELVADEARFKKLLAEAMEKGTLTGTTTQP